MMHHKHLYGVCMNLCLKSYDIRDDVNKHFIPGFLFLLLSFLKKEENKNKTAFI